MADKRINDLPAVESLADDGLLPVYQDGGAKRISGEQLRSFAGMNITGATVGQIAKIAAVDNTGKPTAWEAVNMPSGGGGGGGESAVFYAIYGTTTLAEIKAAHDAGKAVYMKKDTSRFIYPLVSLADSYARFVFVSYSGDLRRCICLYVDRDVWEEDEPTPLAEKPVSTAVTLLASGWNSSSKTHTVTVSGVLADETKQLIIPTPALASQTAYYGAGIRCTNQAANSLTFTAKTIPTADLTVYVTIQEVGA